MERHVELASQCRSLLQDWKKESITADEYVQGLTSLAKEYINLLNGSVTSPQLVEVPA